MPAMFDDTRAEEMEILTRSKTARLINRSKKAGARKLKYIVGRHQGIIYFRLTAIIFTPGKKAKERGRAPIGSWIKTWIPFDVFVPALEEWHKVPLAAASTYLLPTDRTKIFYPFPGPVKVNSTIRGHLVAILRNEEILEASPEVSNLDKEHVGYLRAGFKSVAGKKSATDILNYYRSCEALSREGWDSVTGIYGALAPSLQQLIDSEG